MSFKLGFPLLLIVLVSFSMFMVEQASSTVSDLNLPLTPVSIEAFNGTASYFYVLLGNVSAGYDVINRTYRGWCIDIRTNMIRSPAIHQVMLFSTYTPPLVLPDERWDMVNYILNHKQGNAEDIQQAIWNFISLGDNFTASSPNALAMINDAEANGTGFVPTDGEIVAVVCYPLDPLVQISIIEVPPQTLITDLNCDGVVNMVDVTLVAMAFRATPGSPDWSNLADVNHDGIINIADISLVAKDFMKTSP